MSAEFRFRGTRDGFVPAWKSGWVVLEGETRTRNVELEHGGEVTGGFTELRVATLVEIETGVLTAHRHCGADTLRKEGATRKLHQMLVAVVLKNLSQSEEHVEVTELRETQHVVARKGGRVS